MANDIFATVRSLQDNEHRKNADKLPTREEFGELSKMFRVGAVGGGGLTLSTKQCQLLSQTFGTLSVADIIVDKN